MAEWPTVPEEYADQADVLTTAKVIRAARREHAAIHAFLVARLYREPTAPAELELTEAHDAVVELMSDTDVFEPHNLGDSHG